MVAPGTTVTKTATAVATKPRWMTLTGTTLSGTAELPSGFRRLVYVNNLTRYDESVTVDPVILPADTHSPWRCVIYAPNGSYLVLNGMDGIPTLGTPVVRLSDNAPSKATVNIPIGRGPENIRAPTFARWSDGHAEMVKRGMELTVEYRDADSNDLVMVFRGRIYQMTSGEYVEVVAYDRLMDLAQFSDQYQPVSGAITAETTYNRSIEGSTYRYALSSPVGSVQSCRSINLLRYDSLADQTTGSAISLNIVDIVLNSVPIVNGIGPTSGTITHLALKFNASGSTSSAYIHARIYFVHYVRGGGQFLQKHIAYAGEIYHTGSGLSNYDMSCDVSWDLSSSEGEHFFGFYREIVSNNNSRVGVNGMSSSTLTYLAHRQAQNDWFTPSAEYLPQVAITWRQSNGLIDPDNITPSGSTIAMDASVIPAGPAGPYLTTDNLAAGMIVSYFPLNAVPVRNIVIGLLTNAGLEADVPSSRDLGNLTYYTTSTYDYLTCLHELLRAYNMGLRDNVLSAGEISVNPRHNVTEIPTRTVTTSPEGQGERIIVAHDVTAHWMAEKATVAIITEDSTTASFALALETDDARYDDALVDILETPLRQVITDNSMGTHQMLASAVAGKIIQLHTNVFEGTVTLADYRVSLWDLYGSGEGGMPIGIDIPEYDAQGTAVPTEMEIGNGVTVLKLNNIRTADRSEVANSMGMSADAISNGATQLPKMVYLFAVGKSASGSLTKVELLDGSGNVIVTQSTPAYLKTADDNAGYNHACAVFPPVPGSAYSAHTPIASIRCTVGGSDIVACLTNPKIAVDSQGIHVDVRMPK